MNDGTPDLPVAGSTRRNVFLVSYDVCDAKRLRQTYKKMCGFGTSLQYSVFRCELNPLQLHALKEQLWNILNLGGCLGNRRWRFVVARFSG